MEDASHISLGATYELAQLRAEGISLTDDEIVWINDLCRRVENPQSGSTLPAGRPVKAGNVWLWPFTIQGSAWYDVAVKWFDGEGDTETFCLAYALANGRRAGAFDLLWDAGEARKAIKDFRRILNCNMDELIAAIAAVLPKPDLPDPRDKDKDDEDKAQTDVDWTELLATIMANIGGTADQWIRELSKDFVINVIQVKLAQDAAEGREREYDPVTKATIQLGLAERMIRERRQADNG